MKDANGVFVGNERCKYFLGLDRIVEYKCCGGRKMKSAYVRCANRGVVLADGVCVPICVEYSYGKYQKEESI
jgi:hypothetical protein